MEKALISQIALTGAHVVLSLTGTAALMISFSIFVASGEKTNTVTTALTMGGALLHLCDLLVVVAK